MSVICYRSGRQLWTVSLLVLLPFMRRGILNLYSYISIQMSLACVSFFLTSTEWASLGICLLITQTLCVHIHASVLCVPLPFAGWNVRPAQMCDRKLQMAAVFSGYIYMYYHANIHVSPLIDVGSYFYSEGGTILLLSDQHSGAQFEYSALHTLREPIDFHGNPFKQGRISKSRSVMQI